ncbi:MAG: hypothetical protein ABR510_03975 [Trueperaceae bacterium]
MTPTAPDAPPLVAGPLDPWRASARIGRQLGAWAVASIVLGGALVAFADGAAARAFGLQGLVWGAIDGAIAIAGWVALRRAHARGAVADPQCAPPERRRLRRLLWINAGLDVGYVTVALLLLALWRTPEGLGHGLGVLVQGGFLLAFDAVHARRLRER